MAEVRTKHATVTRLLGATGVAIDEVVRKGEQEYTTKFAAWVGEGHGLEVGDAARFYGELRVKRTEKDGKVYFDLALNDAQVLDGTLVRTPRGVADAGAAGWS